MTDADFKNADLTKSKLINAILIRTKLLGVDFTGVDFTGAIFRNTLIYRDSLSIEQTRQYRGNAFFIPIPAIKLQRNEYNGSNVKINEKMCKSYRKLYERLREATITKSTKFHYIGQTGIDIGGLTRDIFDKYLHLCTFKTPIFILRKNGLKDSSLIYYT